MINIVVVGSINLDLVARTLRLPTPGETVIGSDFQMIPGGKGANQAVAASRLEANVTLIGRVGDDSFGTILRTNLEQSGLNTEHVLTTTGCPSGVALIGVDASGTNAITVIPGANGLLTPADIEQRTNVIAAADVLVVQLETPYDTVATALRLARQHQVRTILDPAPAPLSVADFPRDCLAVDYLSPNQSEACSLSGCPRCDLETAPEVSRRLRELGPRNVVLKLGEAGAFVSLESGETHHIPTHKVSVVDTTAAGDAFTAGLAVGLGSGWNKVEATRFACTVGSLACTRFGAQPAMPTLAEVRRHVP